MRHHAKMVVIVGRDRGTIAHLEHSGLRRDPPGEQQRQCRRTVGRIARRKIIAGHAAVGVQPALDVHQLPAALWLPCVFLLARQLHAHRTADRARQQQRVGGDIVGAVASVAAGRFHPDDIDLGFRPLDQECEIRAQDVRVLRAGPHPDGAVLIIGDRAGRADRSVHLIGPDIGPRHRLGGACNRRIDAALVDQRPWRRRIGAQRRRDVAEIGQGRYRLPVHLQPCRRLDRVLLALGHDADEIADADNGDNSRNVTYRTLVDRDQAGADEIAGIDAGIGRPHDAAMQHAGNADVVDVDQFAGRFRRQVDARHRLPDDGIGIDLLHCDIVG